MSAKLAEKRVSAMKRSCISKIILAFVFLCGMTQFSLFAQGFDIAKAYQQIDDAFARNSAEDLAAVLKTYAQTRDYYLCESYTLKKTRQFIIQNKLDFARAAALVVIDNNIDNFDAVDLYSYIDKAVLAKEAERQAEENKRLLEIERKAAADARVKQKIQTGDTYHSVTTSSGKTVFINEKQVSYSPYTWTFKIGLADVLFQKNSATDYSSIKYGISAGFDLLYPTDVFVFGADTYADVLLLTMGSGEEEILTSIRFIPQLAFSSLCRYAFLRMGFACYGLSSTVRDITGSVSTFATPVVGLGLNNISIGNTSLAVHYDYCLGYFAYDDVTSAMEMGGNVLLPLNVNERTKIGIELGVSDLLFMKDDGMENRTKVTFAIGVGNVVK